MPFDRAMAKEQLRSDLQLGHTATRKPGNSFFLWCELEIDRSGPLPNCLTGRSDKKDLHYGRWLGLGRQ
jgi:hypothetical protein